MFISINIICLNVFNFIFKNSLLNSRYKGEEEVSRGQRPDIIEREVVKVKEHHQQLAHHGHDSGSDLPEHYDLDNSSSIAPSDIDIVYHYKGIISIVHIFIRIYFN